MQKTFLTLFGLLLVSAVALWGCSKAGSSTANSPPPNESEHHDHEDDDHADNHEEHATSDSANADIIAAFAELPADDRALAEKQKICPVTDELLGSMGVPIKIDVKGQSVFICCEGCKEELLTKPDEYLAKLKI